jgi:hypothetical protein
MAVSDLNIEHWDMGKWFYLMQSYPVFWKMFQPYEISRPIWWGWDDFYAIDQTTHFDLSSFQQWNEVFASTLLISNQSSSDVTFYMEVYFDQYVNWHWQNPWTSNWDMWYITIEWKSGDTTWANGSYYWAWVDEDEMRPWISQYRLRLVIDWTELSTINFSQSNLSFDTTPCPNWFMRVEWANICYVPPSYYSWSANTGYKKRIQYDTSYSWATWQTPWMIRVPNDSTDHHIYYTTRNWVVMRTKETYPRPYNPSSTWYSSRWHIWMTPSTQWSPEETGYNYICYIDSSWYKRRLWPWEVD